MRHLIETISDSKFGEKIKFGIVGLSNTMVDFVFFAIFFDLIGITASISQGISYGLALINSYVLNKIWTFNDKQKSVKQFILFLIVNSITWGLSVVTIDFLIYDLNLNFIIAKVLITGLVMVINFTGYKLLVFKN